VDPTSLSLLTSRNRATGGRDGWFGEKIRGGVGHLDKAVAEPPLALARGVEPDRVRSDMVDDRPRGIGAVEGHPPRGDGGVLHVEVHLARIREELAPEKVARGGHGEAEVQRALNFLHDAETVLLGLPLLFGAGAVKGRVTRGAEKNTWRLGPAPHVALARKKELELAMEVIQRRKSSLLRRTAMVARTVASADRELEQ
jgi:hypothetical protein